MTCTTCNKTKKMKQIWRVGKSYVTCNACGYAKYGAKQRDGLKKRFGHKRVFVEWLKRVGCMDCNGVFDPVCMDFDHREPKTKVHGISYLTDNRCSDEVLWSEILKCDLVCSNCHRVRTKNRPRINSKGRSYKVK